MFSLIHPNTPVKVDMGKIHSLQKKIVGKKIIDPLPLFEAVFHFEQFGKAMETAARPETYKVIGKFFNRRTNRQKTKIKLANDSIRLEKFLRITIYCVAHHTAYRANQTQHANS